MNIVLMGRPLTGAAARFSGVVAGPQTSGEAELSGTLGDTAVRGSAKLSAGEDGARMLQDLVVSVGESRASGDIVLGADGLLSGGVKIVSPDLSKVAPLFLVKASGMVRADVTLVPKAARSLRPSLGQRLTLSTRTSRWNRPTSPEKCGIYSVRLRSRATSLSAILPPAA